MIRFGPAGIPAGCGKEDDKRGTPEGIAYCRKMGLSAMEVEFVHGVKMGEETARKAAGVSKENDVKLSCHAPYYINCCAKELPKIKSSIRHIVSCAQAAFWLSASPIVIHSGHYMAREPQACGKLVIKTFQQCLDEMELLGMHGVVLGAELTGKKSAYGSLDEIIGLAQHFGLEKVMPVIDYAHYHARQGRLESRGDYGKILSKVENALGSTAAKSFHCHFSGIEYTDAGERNHLPVSSNSPPFAPLAEAWKENGWEGTVICESPLIEKDALVLQKEMEKARLKEAF